MSFQEAVQSVLHKYADFTGRARRSEYWYWTLAVFIAYVVCLVLVEILRALGLLLLVVLILGVIVPGLAVTVRRLHDTGRTGWWILIGLVPFGGIVLLVFVCLDSTPVPNAYGPPPKSFPGMPGPGPAGMPPPPPAPV
jgi:uncharacterized membrane protein YhaH (DUF805 family)